MINTKNANQENKLQINNTKDLSEYNAFLLTDIFIALQNELRIKDININEARHEIQNLEKKYADLYEISLFGYCTFDERGCILDINQAAADLIGLQKTSLISKMFSRYVAPESQLTFYHHRSKAVKFKKPQTDIIKLMRRNGAFVKVKLCTHPIVNEKSESIDLLSFICHYSEMNDQDATFDPMTQNAMSHYTFYLDEFGANVSYAINQPLTVIANYLNGCISRLKKNKIDPTLLLTTLQKSIQQCYRANDIVLRLKNAVTKNQYNYEEATIDSVIMDILPLIQHEILGTDITLHILENKHLPLLKMDKIHIGQVILNLARNAIESLRDKQVENPRLTIESNYYSASKIVVTVMDNGPPINEEIVSKIYDPHFTTKPYGIGYGLSMCRAIIEAHQGEISFFRCALEGNSFKFTLPIIK